MKECGKKRIRELLIVLLALCMAIAMMPFVGNSSAYADDTTAVNVTGTYNQTSARSILSMINAFRTSSDAWYWNSDDKTKTVLTDLKEYTYDYNLEQIAMQRAAEIALSFDHVRPDYQLCFSCEYNGTTSWDENIAAGSSTAKGAFAQWREDNEKSAGQLHRQSMLSSESTAVGIAHFKYNGEDYWVQEFGTVNSGAGETAANDSVTKVPVNVDTTALSSIKASPSSVNIPLGGSANIPVIAATTTFDMGWPSTKNSVTLDGAWNVADSSIVTMNGGKLVANQFGVTTMSAVASNGASVSATVKVVPAQTAGLKLKNGKKKFTAIWKKDTAVSGYQLMYAKNKRFTKAKKTVVIKKSTINKSVVKKLKSRQTYYVKVRSFKKIGSQMLYGSYSAAKKVKAK